MTTRSTSVKVAIVGLGNILLMDDGVGVHAARALREHPIEGVPVFEAGTAALDAMALLEQMDEVIAIDAVKAGGAPGDVYVFDANDADVTDRQMSLHNMGIVDVLRLMPAETRPAVTVVGVEPERLEFGMELSPAAQASLPRVLETVRQIAGEIRARG